VSAHQIKVAITLFNIVGPAGNSTFGLPSTQEQQENYQQVIDAINASGGVACRKLVAQFYTVNPVDQSDLQQKCLDIVQAGVFMEIDAGAYTNLPAMADCFPQNRIPFLGTALLPSKQVEQFYPYLFGRVDMEVLYKNTIMALNARGFFSAANKFNALGILYRDCIPQLYGEFTGWLQQVGIPSSKIVSYDVGCPTAYADPSQLSQAILKFEQHNVSHVTELQEFPDFSNFTILAEQQGFHPRYGLPDDGILATAYGSQHDDYSNIANAIIITSDRYGEERTPGMAPTAGTARCNAIFQSHGRPPVYQQPVGDGGIACSELWEVAAAIDHAPALQRTALAAGLQAARSLDFSYPYGPANFTGSGVTYGDEFWRPDQFFASCNCWRVIDPTFHPSF
jgi:hypothetical protein